LNNQIKKSPPVEILEEQQPQALFPEIYTISSLRIDTTLPLIKFNNISDSVNTKQKFINASVKIPEGISKADLYLFIDKNKYDSFYQVNSGDYYFKKILLEPGKNLLEFFYRIGTKRSLSVYSIIIRE